MCKLFSAVSSSFPLPGLRFSNDFQLQISAEAVCQTQMFSCFNKAGPFSHTTAAKLPSDMTGLDLRAPISSL